MESVANLTTWLTFLPIYEHVVPDVFNPLLEVLAK